MLTLFSISFHDKDNELPVMMAALAGWQPVCQEAVSDLLCLSRNVGITHCFIGGVNKEWPVPTMQVSVVWKIACAKQLTCADVSSCFQCASAAMDTCGWYYLDKFATFAGGFISLEYTCITTMNISCNQVPMWRTKNNRPHGRLSLLQGPIWWPLYCLQAIHYFQVAYGQSHRAPKLRC